VTLESPAAARRGTGTLPGWRGVAAPIACVSAVGIGLSLMIPLSSLLLEERGVSNRAIGLVTATAGLSTLLVAPYSAALARRMGTTRLLLAAILLASAGFAALYWAGPLWQWLGLRFLSGIGLAILFIVSEFWINAVAPDRQRGLVMGLYATVLSLGFAVGPLALAATGTQGFLPFAVGAGLMLLGAVPALLGSGEAPVVGKPAGRGFVSFLFAAPSATLAGFIYGAGEAAVFSFLPLFGLRTGFGTADAALLVTLVALGNVVLQIPLGLLSDRTSRPAVLLGCALTGLLGAALMPLIGNNLWLAAAVLVPWGGVVAGLYTVGLTHLGSRFSGAELANANAAFVTLYSLGMLVGPTGAGLAMDAAPVLGLPLALGAMFLVYIAVVAWRMRATRRAALP